MTILVLIAINVLVSLAGFRALQPDGGGRSERFLFIPHQVARGENGLGMLLAHFAHGGVGHLLFNMLALYSFGGPVLAALGPARFVLIYVVAGIGSDLVVFALHQEDPTYRCLGASGSVIIAVFLILQKHRGGVSHEGHLGGALIGLAVTALLAPRGLEPLVRWLTQWT